MNRQFHLGVFAALFAAWAFSFNFVVPFVIGEFSTFDFAFVRHVVSGMIGLCILVMESEVSRYLTLRNYLVTAWLAFIGYVGYFLTVTGAAIYCGPVIAPAFLAVVPIVLALVGNQRQRSLPWRSLMMPLILVLAGLVFVNGAAFANGSLDTGRSLWIGIPLAITAVVLWVWFAIANQAALAARPDMPSAVWSALMLTGGGMQMLAFFPVGTAIGLFELPRLGPGERLRVGIARRRRLDLRVGHGTRPLPVGLVREQSHAAVRQHLDQATVTLPSGYRSTLLAHAASPVSPR